MTRLTRLAGSPPAAVEEALQRLGRNIRTARLRRRLPQAALAERMGVSRFVVADVERGKPTTGVAAYVGALWALGLLGGLSEVAEPDRDEEQLLAAESTAFMPPRWILAGFPQSNY